MRPTGYADGTLLPRMALSGPLRSTALRMASEYDVSNKPRSTDGPDGIRITKTEMLVFGLVRVNTDWRRLTWADSVFKHRR